MGRVERIFPPTSSYRWFSYLFAESGGLERTFRPEGKLLLKTVFGEMQNNNNKNHLNVKLVSA